MADSICDLCNSVNLFKNLIDFKCEKCAKKVKNGVQCNGCEGKFHFKCAVTNIDENSSWSSCPTCGDSSAPISITEVRCQELERSNLLLLGENAAYKAIIKELKQSYTMMSEKISNLEVQMNDIKLGKDAVSKDTNQTKCLKNNEQIQYEVENNSTVKQMSRSVLLGTVDQVNEPALTGNIKPASRQDIIKQVPNKPVNDKEIVNIKSADRINNNNNLENDGFQMVVKKKSFRKPVIGQNNESTSLSIVPKRGWIHLSRLAKETTEDDIVKFLKSKKSNESFDCTKLETKGTTASFKVGYNFNIHNEVNEATFWPKGIAVRRYFFHKAKAGMETT